MLQSKLEIIRIKEVNNMIFVWITFIWMIAMIIYYTWKWRKEKKKERIFKTRMRNYNRPMNMSIGKRIEYKERYRK